MNKKKFRSFDPNPGDLCLSIDLKTILFIVSVRPTPNYATGLDLERHEKKCFVISSDESFVDWDILADQFNTII